MNADQREQWAKDLGVLEDMVDAHSLGLVVAGLKVIMEGKAYEHEEAGRSREAAQANSDYERLQDLEMDVESR